MNRTVSQIEDLIKRKQGQIAQAAQQHADRIDFGHSDKEINMAKGRITMRERELWILKLELAEAIKRAS